MALDSHYVVAISLGEYIVDKDTGIPLALGQIQFWKDDNRVVPKLVYELTGAPPNYDYAALPNPLFLNAAGLPVNDLGQNIAVYYYPYDDNGNIELYDVKCYSLGGVLQWERQAWPNITPEDNPVQNSTSISNQISNPQFVDFLTAPLNTFTIDYTGASVNSYAIMPDWNLVVDHSGAGTITVTRNPIAGSLGYPNNPPYTLSITAGINLNALSLVQTLNNNPNVFGRPVGSPAGYVASSVLLAPASSLNITYQPNGGVAQTVLTANNVGGTYAEFKETTQLTPAANASTGDTGFVTISVNLPIVGTTTFSNIQVVGISSDIDNVPFDQTTANRQRDLSFNYYKSLLSYKPIKSFLTGWDFYLNPAQFLGDNVGPFATGANTSSYYWDQTIIFQSLTSSIQTSRNLVGDLVITSPGGGQFALVQYLPAKIARKILSGKCSVNILANCGMAGGINGFVHLLYTTAGALPNIAANLSVVATLNANGSLATANGAWTFVPRNGISAPQFSSFNLPFGVATNVAIENFDASAQAGASNATFFAIVVGFSALGAGDAILFKSISVVPGAIATIPAPQTESEARLDCGYYYRKSYSPNVLPGTIGFNTGEYYDGVTIASPNNCIGAEVKFPVPMASTPTVTIYSPFSGLNQIATPTGPADFTGSGAGNITVNGFFAAGVAPGGVIPGDFMCYHWTARAMLGF